MSESKEQMYKSRKKRLNEALVRSGKSIPEIVKLIGVTDKGVRKWFETGRIADYRLKPLAEILGCDELWLATGHKALGVREFETEYKTDRDIMIPVYDVELSAGDGMAAPEFVETDRKLPFDSQWLNKNNLQVNECAVLKVKGDSMEPTLEDGDSVLIDRSKTDIIDRKIYAIVLGDDLKIKRVVRKYDGSLEIISDNPVHGNEVIPVADVDHVIIIGRAVYRSGNL